MTFAIGALISSLSYLLGTQVAYACILAAVIRAGVLVVVLAGVVSALVAHRALKSRSLDQGT